MTRRRTPGRPAGPVMRRARTDLEHRREHLCEWNLRTITRSVDSAPFLGGIPVLGPVYAELELTFDHWTEIWHIYGTGWQALLLAPSTADLVLRLIAGTDAHLAETRTGGAR